MDSFKSMIGRGEPKRKQRDIEVPEEEVDEEAAAMQLLHSRKWWHIELPHKWKQTYVFGEKLRMVQGACLVLFANFLMTLAIALPEWLIFNTRSSGKTHVGLWKSCAEDGCSSIDKVHKVLVATRVLACLAYISGWLTILVIAGDFADDVADYQWLDLAVIGVASFTSFLCFVTFCVYPNIPSDNDDTRHHGASYGFVILCWLIYGGSVVFFYLSWKFEKVDWEKVHERMERSGRVLARDLPTDEQMEAELSPAQRKAIQKDKETLEAGLRAQRRAKRKAMRDAKVSPSALIASQNKYKPSRSAKQEHKTFVKTARLVAMQIERMEKNSAAGSGGSTDGGGGVGVIGEAKGSEPESKDRKGRQVWSGKPSKPSKAPKASKPSTPSKASRGK